MKSCFCVCLLIAVTFSGLLSEAAAVQSKTKITTEQPTAIKDWGGMIGYRIGTDLQKSGEQRVYTNSLMSEFYYDVTPSWGVSSSTALRWVADGQNISNEQDNPFWDDLSVSMDYNTSFTPEIKWNASISNDFPTGNDSRNESIKDTAGVMTGVIASYFDKTLILGSNLTLTRLFHSYDISTVSGESNVDNMANLSATISYKPYQEVTFALMHAFNSVHQINGELQSKNTSTISAAYKYKRAKFKLEHVLGNYDKQDGYKLLFVDDTKRVFRIGVSFEI